MESKDIDRLLEVQKQLLHSTQERLKQDKGFRDDYVKLRKRLETLPDKVSYDVQVPLSRFAFMPGRLVHTNEIMVLLSDVWFVERSSKQAMEIVDRRMADLDQRIDKLYKEQSLIEPRLTYTSELQQAAGGEGEFVEIKEPYDEEKERIWKERRKLQKKANAAQQPGVKVRTTDAEGSDEDFWRRLKALEDIENENDELNKLEETPHEDLVPPCSESELAESLISLSNLDRGVNAEHVIPGSSSHLSRGDSASKHRSVTWNDNQDLLAKEDIDDDDDDDDDDDVVRKEKTVIRHSSLLSKTIHFVHTDAESSIPVIAKSESTEEGQETIKSPADIYNLLMSRPKSILKNRATTKDESSSDRIDVDDHLASHQSASTFVSSELRPFTQIIKERTIDADDKRDGSKTESKSSDMDSSSGSKKLSKFKMARMKSASK